MLRKMQISVTEQETKKFRQIINIIGAIDPDLIQCEQCRRYKNIKEVSLYISPTKRVHPYCNDCYIPSSDD